MALAVIFFLADAVQLLLLLPDRTGELFAWAIDPQVTSFVLAAAYVAGAYFFIRVVMVDSWHRVAAGFPAVIVFVWGAAGATALHLDRFIHDGLSFAAWAAIYAIAPVGLPLLYLARRRAARAVPLADTPMSARTRILLGGVGGAVVLAALLAFALPQITIDLWPWTLTPLTARIVATVMALFGSLWVSVALSGGKTAARIPLEAHGARPRLPADRRGSRRTATSTGPTRSPRSWSPASRRWRSSTSPPWRARGRLRGSGPGGPRVVARRRRAETRSPCSGPPSPNCRASSSPRPATRSCRT